MRSYLLGMMVACILSALFSRPIFDWAAYKLSEYTKLRPFDTYDCFHLKHRYQRIFWLVAAVLIGLAVWYL